MPKKILIVDDEPLIVKGLKYSLEQDNYEIDSAADGEEAINKFFAGQFDLVLLDVMLPKVEGMEVCQRIREHSNVPIIMLTAKGEERDELEGFRDGVVEVGGIGIAEKYIEIVERRVIGHFFNGGGSRKRNDAEA